MSRRTSMSSASSSRHRSKPALGTVGAVLSAALAAFLTNQASAGEQSKEQMIEDALKAAPPTIADTVKVVDWKGNVLREGDATYTCMPTAPDSKGSSPMCLDEHWRAWLDAYINKKPFQSDKVGIAYMLAGDTPGVSNVDPYAQAPTAENQWIAEGPHMMILVPDPAVLEALTTDPQAGDPYVMWKGTPYAHIMLPVGPRPAQTAAQ